MNNDKDTFFMWLTWVFYTYGPPNILDTFLIQGYSLLNMAKIHFNNVMYSYYWDASSETEDEIKCIPKVEPKVEPKYEDKYLDIIRKLDKEWQFTKDELKEKEIVYEEFYQCSVKKIQAEIDELNQLVSNYKNDIDNDNVSGVSIEGEDFDEYGETILLETMEERVEFRKKQMKCLFESINDSKKKIDTDESLNIIKNEAEQHAIRFLANKRIDKLKFSFVIEKTPYGNALMMYDKDKENFRYYSDSTIPYKYLEVVSRKYVKMFNCRPLFIDMEEELNLFEEKWKRENELKNLKETEEKLKAEEVNKIDKPTNQKKNVFAKFKSYNKDTGGKINMAACPKNSIPNNTNKAKESDKIILKERVNRYTYGGKFSNFNFLQKVEKKVFNKKLGFSFADFKKMKK